MNRKQQIGLAERIRRAARGERIIIPCASKQRAHHYMRAAHATALRVGRVVETEAALIVGLLSERTERAVVITAGGKRP